MNKETVARQQITIADVRDGEKGAKGDTGARGANGSNGAAAEFYRLQPRTEKAIVASDNVLRVNLEYTIEHVKGAQISVETGAAQGYHLIAWTNQGVFLTMTAGRVNSGTYQMANYSKTGDRPDFINIELRDNANKTLDHRTVQITMEAASFVNVIRDVRETVSQHGKNITRIEQKADGISLKVDGMKNGVRNLIKGGQLNRTFKTYGIGGDDVMIPLKPDTVYTLTICGHTNNITRANGQMLRAYIFRKDWAWSANTDIDNNSDTISSITFSIPSDKASTDGMYKFDAYPFPDKGSQNSEVTVNWAVVTEGTAPAVEWLPSVEESAEERVKKVEARLENGEFKVKSDKTIFVDNSGKEVVLIENGKMSAELIDAVKIVAAGIQAQEIDAKEAKFKNLTVTGDSTFEGTINTNKGTIAGWKILHGMIGYGKDSDGLSLLDTCLIYNYRNRKRQVIVGEDPKTKISYGADTMLALRNNTRESVRNIGIFIDVAPDKDFVFKDNFAILALRGTYAGFRRKLEVVSDDYTIKKEDSSILFTGRSKKLFTLPSDPEDGEEFTIYSDYGADIDLKTDDGTSIDGYARAPLSTGNGPQRKERCTYRIVFSMVRKTWFVFVQ